MDIKKDLNNKSSTLLILLVFILVFALCSSSSLAWTSYTHTWICNKIGLNDTDCASADNPKVQSEHPDLNFKYHHCAGDAYDCDARTHAEKFLIINTSESRGFAAHLYADSMVPVHWYSFDYDTCHKIFEDKVEEKLRSSENVKYDIFGSTVDLSSWNVTMTCPAKFGKEYKNVTVYADNQYMDMTAKYVADQMHISYTSTSIKSYDLTPIVYVFIAFLISIFALFMYFGMKNKNTVRNKNSIKRKK